MHMCMIYLIVMSGTAMTLFMALANLHYDYENAIYKFGNVASYTMSCMYI